MGDRSDGDSEVGSILTSSPKRGGSAMSSLGRRLFRYTRHDLQSLADNTAHQFAAKYALSIYVADAIYSFIPKNACSTMRYTIGLANGTIADASDFNWIHQNNATFRASLGELVKAKYTFAILRDPFLRIGSCYLDKMVDQTAVAWQYHTATDYRTPPPTLTFREFIAGVKSRLRSNEHWRPQLDFLVYETYDDFFCLEAFSHAVATLSQRIGLDVQDARRLTKHGTDQFEPLDGDQCFADTPAHEIAALKRTGKIPRIIDLYDPPLVEEVRKIYRADIALYRKAIGRPLAFPLG
jgi:Sulfotransferase family